jgi:hypothetical protein
MKSVLSTLMTVAVLAIPLVGQAKTDLTQHEGGKLYLDIPVSCSQGQTQFSSARNASLKIKGSKYSVASSLDGMAFKLNDAGNVSVVSRNNQDVVIAKLDKAVSDLKFFDSKFKNSGTCAQMEDGEYLVVGTATILDETPLVLNVSDVEEQCKSSDSMSALFTGSKIINLKTEFVNKSNGNSIAAGETTYIGTCTSLKTILGGAAKLPFLPLYLLSPGC